jgi:hypothetical protein
MKSKVLRALLAVLLLSALLPAGACAETYYEQTVGYVDLYNENLESIPGLVKRLFASERINFHIALAEGEEIIGVATSGSCEILEFQEGGLENPTLLVYIKAETIEGIKADPSQEKVLAALKELRIEGVGLVKKLKVAFLNLVRMVAGWFF